MREPRNSLIKKILTLYVNPPINEEPKVYLRILRGRLMAISADLTLSTLQSVASLNTVTAPAASPQSAQGAQAASSVPAQLAADTYTPSGATTSSATTNDQPGPETTLDGHTLAQNQVISADSDVRSALLQAGGWYVTPTDQAWSTLTQSLASGNVAAAQTALTNYTQALPTDPGSLSPLTSPSTQFLSDLATLGNALQSGDLTAARSDFQTAQYDKPTTNGSAYATAFDTGNTGAEATLNLESVDSIAQELAWLGYTPANAKIEANIIQISAVAGLSTGSSQPDSSQTNQLITDLAKDVAGGPELTVSQSGGTSNNPFYNIVTSLLTLASPSELNKTLELLASTYGAGNASASGSSSDSGPPASTSVNSYA